MDATIEIAKILAEHPIPWTKFTFFGDYAYDANGKAVSYKTAMKVLDCALVASKIMNDLQET